MKRIKTKTIKSSIKINSFGIKSRVLLFTIRVTIYNINNVGLCIYKMIGLGDLSVQTER